MTLSHVAALKRPACSEGSFVDVTVCETSAPIHLEVTEWNLRSRLV